MESNITHLQISAPAASLPEPHFDEEATVLSARPVVPIQKPGVTSGFARPWIFWVAVAAALLLGVSATAFYYSNVRTSGSQVATADTFSSGVEGTTSESVAVDQPAIEAGSAKTHGSPIADSHESNASKDQTASDAVAVDSNKVTTRPPFTSSKPAPATPKRRAEKREVVDDDSQSEYDTHQQLREAKREIKERRRKYRERRAGKSDELLRIRDIFEGPARP